MWALPRGGFLHRKRGAGDFNIVKSTNNFRFLTILVAIIVKMESIVSHALTNSYHKRLAYLENKTIISLSDYAKQLKLSHANLINKAKRQTIEAFMERGIWKIGIPKEVK